MSTEEEIIKAHVTRRSYKRKRSIFSELSRDYESTDEADDEDEISNGSVLSSQSSYSSM